GALIAGHHVAHGVVAHVAHVDAPRRIGEHLQHVVFRPRVVVAGAENAALVPGLLPARLGLAGVVAVGFLRFGGHRPAVVEGASAMGKGARPTGLSGPYLFTLHAALPRRAFADNRSR